MQFLKCPYLYLSFLSLAVVAVYEAKLTKVVWSPFSSSAHGGIGVGEGADSVPLGTFSPFL